jgi:16S rRNA processing protein RimM
MADWVLLGHVSGLYGVKGWVRVFSHTQPRQGIIYYKPLYLEIQGQRQPLQVERSGCLGKGLVIKFSGFDNRDDAAILLGCDIGVQRDQLPPVGPGHYYWRDLQGLCVINLQGVELGVVAKLMETGANDVLVVRGNRERLLPFLLKDVIVEIDFDKGVMWVDWDATF